MDDLITIDASMQDLVWLHLALKSFETNNPEIVAKCDTFDATVDKIANALLEEGVLKIMG